MRGFLTRFLGGAGSSAPVVPQQLHLSRMPPLTFVVGDVHGCADLYRKLETRIARKAQTLGQPVLVVLLGDMVDRGPESAALLDHLTAPPPEGVQRLALMGNHEEKMLAFLDAPAQHRDWLGWGGRETLASYGVYGDAERGFDLPEKRLRQMIEASIPTEHGDWLRKLPVALNLGDRYFLCHAGIDPDKPLADQTPRNLMWARGMEAPPPSGVTVVHGHTPVETVDTSGPYIDVDTGAYASGRLSALLLTSEGECGVVEVS